MRKRVTGKFSYRGRDHRIADGIVEVLEGGWVAIATTDDMLRAIGAAMINGDFEKCDEVEDAPPPPVLKLRGFGPGGSMDFEYTPPACPGEIGYLAGYDSRSDAAMAVDGLYRALVFSKTATNDL